MNPKLSLSIADLPLGIGWEDLFSLAKNFNLDGIEVVLGYKTLLKFENILKLSLKYNIPILTVHEPGWSTFGFFNYEGSFKTAKEVGASYNAHPKMLQPVCSEKSKKYFRWLSEMSRKYNVEVLLENLPPVFGFDILDAFLKADKTNADLKEIKNVCKEYNFNITLDTSHLQAAIPQEAAGFEESWPFIKNIHLSSFNKTRQHLSLTKGFLDINKFLDYLKLKNYGGSITIELTVKLFYPRQQYFKEIEESVEIIKKYFK
ncbi:MAG: TIM barrel protein [Candidatus Levybacteria bacterium]|nr:TIM barrel protein [Candidatus Levybacteria bacterium]